MFNSGAMIATFEYHFYGICIFTGFNCGSRPGIEFTVNIENVITVFFQPLILFLHHGWIKDQILLANKKFVGNNIFPGAVSKMTYLGDRSDYRIAVGEGLMLRVQTDGKVRFGEGENVKVHLPVPLCRVIAE